MEYVLETKGLSKRYRSFKALDGVDMRVPKGSIYGFVGRNGAGKTTLIRVICGLQKPTSGGYSIYGIDGESAGISKSRRRMGAVVESPSIYLDMSAYGNIMQQYRILGLPSYDGIDDLLRLVGLEHTGKKRARNFSLGMKQRLGIAVALAGDPDFLVLDEPINGLDPEGIVEIRELILKLNRERNITVLISSHILDELSKLATCYGFIDHGRVVKEITSKELENACRKAMRATVSDTGALCRALDKLGAEYSVVSDSEADVYTHISVTALTGALSEEGCELISLNERTESLESYYIKLVGGDAHD